MGCYRMPDQKTRGHGAKGDGAVRAWKDLHNFCPASILTADTAINWWKKQHPSCPPRHDLEGQDGALSLWINVIPVSMALLFFSS